MPAKTFKALGLLLCYPENVWLDEIGGVYDLIRQEGMVLSADLTRLEALTSHFSSSELLELQEEYVETFDRVRSLSLHLFEHVHGESRDRGQAMVDLSERYQELGFTLAASELPDYLPVFLEYLSLLPQSAALEELAETGHILTALGKRLNERGSPYGIILDTLTRLAGKKPEAVDKRVVEKMSFEQLDKEWEERPIDFLGAEAPQGSGCNSTGCSGSCSGISTSSLHQPSTQGASV